MLLATVLDSFCINNNIEICKKPITFGRTMGFWTMLTQDAPQFIIHLLFLFFLDTEISHSELTVVMSLFVSIVAVCISTFNIIMCSPNEFDPVILQLEFKRRKEIAEERHDRLNQQKEMFKQRMSVSKPALTRNLVQSFAGSGLR